MSRLRAAACCVVLTLAVACVPRAHSGLAVLDDASSRAAKGTTSAHELALAGFHALLVNSDGKQARHWFDEALARDPKNAWALEGQVQLAAAEVQPLRALHAALDVCERAPEHPLSAMAARQVLELAGQASSIDDLIRQRVPLIFERHQVRGDTAHLLRAALLNAALDARDVKARDAIVSDMGSPSVMTLVGPFSPWHQLSMAEPTSVEKNGSLDALAPGPFGALKPREVHFADGRFALSGEPPAGDIYVLAVDVTVPEKTTWVLRTITSMDHVAVIDGSKVLSRLTWQTPASTLTSAAFTLKPGVHRLVVRVAREHLAGNLSLSLHRLDGQPAQLKWAAAKGTATSWGDSLSLRDEDALYPTAQSFYAALVDDAGDALARFLAARDALGRDHDGAARLAAGLPESLASAAVSMLRADVAAHDPLAGQRVARGRANRELEAALTKDPHFIQGLLAQASMTLDEGRHLEALEQVKAARAASASASPAVAMLQARIQLAMGLDAAAVASAAEVLALLPGHCEAAILSYDIARRRDAAAASDQWLTKTASCSGYLPRAGEHHRSRGATDAAIDAYSELLRQDESQAQVATTLAGLFAAKRDFDTGLRLLENERAVWPRNTTLLKAMADLHEQAGRSAQALMLREEALGINGADLPLLRQVERAKTGREVLQEEAISTSEALKGYQPAPGSDEATSTFVLDAAAIRALPDGSMVDRIHIIQKALDQQGVQDVAEVQIPSEATVLTLRTIKPDGRTLEPENIEGKEGTSLPGVQVGDFIEYEYLLAHPSRGPGQPGFTASNFYFQIARQPNARSTYVVKAPKGSHLKVDAHNVVAPAPVVEGEFEVFRHEERSVPPSIPEPVGPPSPNEWLPFVAVGAGTEGDTAMLQAFADSLADRGLINWEVEAFARQSVGTAAGREAVKAVYAAVHTKLSGRDLGLGASAANSVSQDRGSRTMLLYASLRALGFDTRLAVVRTFTADPAAYVFPSEGLFNYVCVHVKLADGQVIWLDPVVRYAPFDELPEVAMGQREAWLLAEPGKPAQRVSTPSALDRRSKQVDLTMRLTDDGVLSGSGVETYSGFEAAQLGEALDSMSTEQRDQALQSALSRYFGGADLSKLRVDAKREIGGSVTVAYEFVARRFARVDGPGRLTAGALTFPHMLGRRFIGTSSRVTPLFVDGTETARVAATVTLPVGYRLAGLEAEVKLDGPNARYVRQERQDHDTLLINEDFVLRQARVPVKAYEAFAQFAGEVDLVQQRDLAFEKK